MNVIKTISVIYDKELKPEAEAPAIETIEYLKEGGCDVLVNPKMFNDGIDAVIVYGGDGLLLHTANQVAMYKIPILGINYGRVGYLCQANKNDAARPSFWDKILNHNFKISYRTRIMAEITNCNNVTEYVDALNEISIGGIDKTVYLSMFVNQEKVFLPSITVESIGDGIIFSTKTGSTAYNVNAGGSVLLTDAFSVVANNSIFKSDKLPVNTKSFTTDTDTIFKIDITNKRAGNLPYLIADGQRSRKLIGYDKIVIKKSCFDTRLIVV